MYASKSPERIWCLNCFLDPAQFLSPESASVRLVETPRLCHLQPHLLSPEPVPVRNLDTPHALRKVLIISLRPHFTPEPFPDPVPVRKVDTLHAIIKALIVSLHPHLTPSPFPEPVPVRNVDTPHALPRPHASASMMQRQGSFRGFSQLNQVRSPTFFFYSICRRKRLGTAISRCKEIYRNLLKSICIFSKWYISRNNEI